MACCYTLLTNLILAVCATTFGVNGSVLPRDELDDLNSHGINVLKKFEKLNLEKRSGGKCNLSKVAVWKDWTQLSKAERRNYNQAVLCLQSKPSKSPSAEFPRVISRYDDFVRVPIEKTLTIHVTGNFFGWYRYFLHTYEKALREECGYKGYQPYWAWNKTPTDNPLKSPLFDGSDTSLGGDGSFVAHNGSLAGKKLIFILSGKGGGCITTGPYKKMVANLGPNAPTMDGITKSVGLTWNPRCLRRDISTYILKTWLNTGNIIRVISQKTFFLFNQEVNGRFTEGYLGLHSAGHFAVGAEMNDLFSSPVDPMFWLHHAMIDRVWFIWQALHAFDKPVSGFEALFGTNTIENNPPSANTTLDDLQNIGYNAPDIPLRDLMNTIDGALCYIYL